MVVFQVGEKLGAETCILLVRLDAKPTADAIRSWRRRCGSTTPSSARIRFHRRRDARTVCTSVRLLLVVAAAAVALLDLLCELESSGCETGAVRSGVCERWALVRNIASCCRWNASVNQKVSENICRFSDNLIISDGFDYYSIRKIKSSTTNYHCRREKHVRE